MAFYKTELQDQGRTFPWNSKRTGLGSVRRLRVRVFLWPCFCVLFVCVFQKLVFFLKSDVPFFLVQGKFLFRAGSLDVTTWNLGGFERSHVWVSSFFMWFWIDFTTTSTCLRHVRLHGWQTQRTTWLGPLVSRLRNHATKTCRSRVGMFWISRSIFWSLLHVNINFNLQLRVDEQILKQNRLKKRSKTGFHMMRMILHHIVYSRWWFLTELKNVLQLNLKSCSNRGVQKKTVVIFLSDIHVIVMFSLCVAGFSVEDNPGKVRGFLICRKKLPWLLYFCSTIKHYSFGKRRICGCKGCEGNEYK